MRLTSHPTRQSWPALDEAEMRMRQAREMREFPSMRQSARAWRLIAALCLLGYLFLNAHPNGWGTVL